MNWQLVEQVIYVAKLDRKRRYGAFELKGVAELRERLVSDDTAHHGEICELIEILEQCADIHTIADELADVVYYAAQFDERTGYHFRLLEWLERDLLPHIGFTIDEALQLAVIKFDARTRYGKDKTRERGLVRRFVEGLRRRPRVQYDEAIGMLRHMLAEADCERPIAQKRRK